MVNNTTTWVVVWVVIIAIIALFTYPSGESTILFGFWPSNAFIMVAVGTVVAIAGAVFGYDMMYNVYPERERIRTVKGGGE